MFPIQKLHTSDLNNIIALNVAVRCLAILLHITVFYQNSGNSYLGFR
jgi:hypothetical protein